MAAGRQDVSRRRNLYNYSRREYDHYRNGSHDVELRRGRDHSGSHRNGYHSSSRALCSGSRQDRFSGRSEERKLDEWSKVAEVSDYEDAVRIPAEKKRKFSPIVWDREEKEVRVSSKNRVALVAPLSLPSPPSSCVEVLDVVSDVGVLKNPISANQVDGLKGLEDKCAVTDGLVGVFDSESRAEVSPLLPPEGFGGGGQGQDQVEEEEEEVVQVRNITMSRWASDSDSPRDLSGDDDSPDTRRSSPESGEIRIGDSVEGKARSSVSDEEYCRVVPISGDTYCENELFDVDSMEIDDKHDGNRGVNLSDSDSEVDGDSNLTEEPAVPTQRSVNMLQSCRSVFEFEKLNKINEGTYGIVYKAKDKKTGEIVALKKVKMGVGREEGFPLSSLREMNILLSFNHPSIVGVKEVVMDDDLDGVFMVMEYMEHDLKGLLEVMKQPFGTSEVKCLMLQLLQGVKSLHDNWVLHRDLKTSNILVSKEGELKICDFGLSRQYGSPLKPFTPVVVTLWYRAPELLLGTEQYSTAIDMWSVGCIMAELVTKEPLFKGKNEVDQLVKIFKTLGTPSEVNWPGLSKLRGVRPNFKQPYNLLRTKFPARSFTGSPVLSDLGFDLLNKLLAYDPDKRITAEDALNHEWFHEVPLPKSDFKHTFPLWHGQER